MKSIEEIINKVHCADCIAFMKEIPDNCIDSVVTDPPYELGFMGKSWDGTGIAYNVNMWKEVLRVLKPGGHLLSFGGTRTYHRMACAIEDAGFQVRDMIQWIYGCLSEDTEVLTENGFKLFGVIKPSERILVYDIQRDIYQWEKPERWQCYSVNQDTAYRIQSDNTDQIVSRNHRCIVEREGVLEFIPAEKLFSVESLPTLSNNFYWIQKTKQSLLFKGMQWFLSRTRMEKVGINRFFDGNKGNENSICITGSRKSIMERWGYLQKQEGIICKSINKVCSLSERVFNYVTKRWLCHGTSFKSCNRNWQTFDEKGKCSSYKPQCRGQQVREFNVIQDKCGTQDIRRRSTYTTTMATITPIKYSGIIFCPTVSTGAFVARRNGKIFITGNSGFPKSLNIGKAIDKMQGNEREFVGTDKGHTGDRVKNHEGLHDDDGYEWKGEFSVTKGNSPFEGWGTALKPANEPICLARKPLYENTVAENVLKWGTGGINIDGCRIGTEPIEAHGGGNNGEGRKYGGGKGIPSIEKGSNSHIGRFPSNFIHDGSEEVMSEFNKYGVKKSGTNCVRTKPGGGYHGNIGKAGDEQITYGDEGSVARFFYCAKSSRQDRDDGLEDIAYKNPSHCYGKGFNTETKVRTEEQHSSGVERSLVHNGHPCVKPNSLMKYLCRLITPPNGIVLDPFAGSGSTGKAALQEGFRFIGIEKEKEYCDIANKRIWVKDKKEKTKKNEKSTKIVEPKKEEGQKQILLFEETL